jgi:hypothetical protein
LVVNRQTSALCSVATFIAWNDRTEIVAVARTYYNLWLRTQKHHVPRRYSFRHKVGVHSTSDSLLETTA